MPSRLILIAPKGKTADPAWLEGVPYEDLRFSGDRRAIAVFSRQPPNHDLPCDIFHVPENAPLPKLLICDMDSTIIESETLDDLAAMGNCGKEIAKITKAAMNGEIGFETALTMRVEMLGHLYEQDIYNLLPRLKISEGAEELVAAAKNSGMTTILVSGGFKHVTSYIAEKLGFDYDFANEFILEKAQIAGVKTPILGKEAKLEILENYCERLGIGRNEVMAIGDGANDIPMLCAAGYGIAYKAKPIVREQVALQINTTDLSAARYLFAAAF